MAITLKQNSTYQDRRGNTYTSAYGVINQLNTNKLKKSGLVVLELYVSKEKKEEGKLPIDQINFVIDKKDYEAFFACSEIVDNHFKTGYLYILQKREMIEDPETGEALEGDLVLKFWESDE